MLTWEHILDWLDLSSESVPILIQPLELNMSPTFDGQNRAFIWVYQDPSGQLFSLSLKFLDGTASEPFREAFTKCMWETNAKDAYDKNISVFLISLFIFP